MFIHGLGYITLEELLEFPAVKNIEGNSKIPYIYAHQEDHTQGGVFISPGLAVLNCSSLHGTRKNVWVEIVEKGTGKVLFPRHLMQDREAVGSIYTECAVVTITTQEVVGTEPEVLTFEWPLTQAS